MRTTKPKAYHAYADELRAVAAHMPSSEAQNRLRDRADDFDRMARTAEALGRYKELLKNPMAHSVAFLEPDHR
jgi:hypothetical protein